MAQATQLTQRNAIVSRQTIIVAKAKPWYQEKVNKLVFKYIHNKARE